MHFSTFATVFGLATLGQAHMIMNTPVPFGKSSLNNSPLKPDGTDFPCKQRSGVYAAEGANNQMALGSDQPLSFTGSAVHGGGSCQISITYDLEPTKNSVWKVIHSIEGGCPMRNIDGNNGNNANAISPSQYSFKVPTDLPTGSAVLAWTWFNKIGNREMYMNCAPITLTGGSTKRDDEAALTARNATELLVRDVAAYNALPDMFEANIGNGCATVDSKNVLFPNPGSSVEKNALADDNSAPPTGNSCPQGSGGAISSVASNVNTSPATSAPAQASSAAATPALPGGVFVTVPADGASTTAPSAPSASASASASSAPAQAPSAAPIAAPSSVSSAAPPAGTGTTGSGAALTGACSPEGQWNCIGGTSFQQCGSGTWSVVQQLAAGTTCVPGQSAAISISAISKAKRAIRFSHEHFRRHLQSS